jgi:hypothetical protein
VVPEVPIHNQQQVVAAAVPVVSVPMQREVEHMVVMEETDFLTL